MDAYANAGRSRGYLLEQSKGLAYCRDMSEGFSRRVSWIVCQLLVTFPCGGWL